jgi:2-polyprenyl-3-methyl-5-hydroxy-6-metoxy-1,4-benzoquinol methylase
MKEGKDGGYYYMRDDEVSGGLQEVCVQGGGCMLIDMNVFSRIPSPWFEPEFKYGTDVQICTKAREQGYSVWCDTSITLGHVKASREVITPENRFRVMAEQSTTVRDNTGGLNQAMMTRNAMNLYQMDASEYLGVSFDKFEAMADGYWSNMTRFDSYENKDDYYRSLGPEQIARQVWFHSSDAMVQQMDLILKSIDTSKPGYALDFGCGSAPVGFEVCMRGPRMDFIDLDGTPAYEFTKWRAKKRGIWERCGWTWGGPYDYILALDVIEHLTDWKPVIDRMVESLLPNGIIITNYLANMDDKNVEHINMDKKAVMSYLTSKGVYPLNQVFWIKRDIGFMDKKPSADSSAA